MQYLVTTNKDRVPNDAQIFVIGNPPLGWQPKPGDFQWKRDRIGKTKYLIDEMPRIESRIESINLLQYLERQQTQQCIVTTQVELDTCVAAVWLQLTKNQQQASQGSLKALSMQCNYLDDCSKLMHLGDFAAGAIVAMQQEESKLESMIGELLGSEYQQEAYDSLVFRVRTELLISACRGDRPWSGEQKQMKKSGGQIQLDALES
jgi:hypothetical protein